VTLAEAIAKAEAAELDLVEIAPMAKPPVCRIMDFGKFKYREANRSAGSWISASSSTARRRSSTRPSSS
jgi:translation initiation factor IF-3